MSRDRDPYVYLLASRRNGTLYLGVTSNLMQRVAQHRAELLGGFTAKAWGQAAAMVRATRNDGTCDPAREADQEVAQSLETRFDRAGEPGLA